MVKRHRIARCKAAFSSRPFTRTENDETLPETEAPERSYGVERVL